MAHTTTRAQIRKRLGLLTAVFLSLQAGYASAQTGATEKFGPEFSGHIGTLLPNQIPGVTEILPAWGLRYSYPLTFGYLEGGVRDSHAKGVAFDVASIDMRFDMNTVEGFTNIFYVGYDMNAYLPANSNKRIWTGGAHLGSGLMMKVASTFWLRTDLSFAVSPGTSLYLGIGFAIRTPAGGG